MNKQEFLTKLKNGLTGLPEDDIKEHLMFYSEMIDDKIEDGVSEERAVYETGSVDGIIAQIISETPITKLMKERVKPKKRLNALEIVLLILGFPIWGSLLIAGFSVVITIYASFWVIIISLWAVFAALIACGISGIVAGIVLALTKNALTGLAFIGGSFVCAGLSVFMFFGCKVSTKGFFILTKKILTGIKKIFIKGRNGNE